MAPRLYLDCAQCDKGSDPLTPPMSHNRCYTNPLDSKLEGKDRPQLKTIKSVNNTIWELL